MRTTCSRTYDRSRPLRREQSVALFVLIWINGRLGEHSAETKPQRPDLLQPLSLSRTQPNRTVLHTIKQCRRIATRYDKLAANYLAIVKLASIRIWLRANESTPLTSKGASTHYRLLRSLYRRIERSPRLLFIKLVNTEVRNSPGRELEVQGAAGR